LVSGEKESAGRRRIEKEEKEEEEEEWVGSACRIVE